MVDFFFIMLIPKLLALLGKIEPPVNGRCGFYCIREYMVRGPAELKYVISNNHCNPLLFLVIAYQNQAYDIWKVVSRQYKLQVHIWFW